MPVAQIPNPTAEEGEAQTMGLHTVVAEYDASASGNLTNGMVLVIEVSDTGPPFLAKKATTTQDFLTLGVVVNAPTGGVAPGGVVEVCVQGVTQVLFDANNTTHGHLAIGSATTAGTATDSATATLGKTIGVILQSVTISSGTALVWCYVHLM